VRLLLDFIVRNWPLKVAAVGLASVLYVGVALSENVRTWPGQVPIEVLDPPAGGSLLEVPGSVTSIRYRAPLDVASRLTTGSFRASIDLAEVQPAVGAPPVEVPVRLVPIDARVEIVDFSPRAVNVRLDQVGSRVISVTVDHGAVPEGLVLGPAQVDPTTVLARGASSRLAAVRNVVARVAVDASGLNVHQQADLEALDETGQPVPGIQLDPQRVEVRMEVAQQLAYASVPVIPTLSGEPAPGFRVASVRADPQVVTVSGEAPAVEQLGSVATEPVDVEGATATVSRQVPIVVPGEVTVIGQPQATVTVTLEGVEATRAYEVAPRLRDVRVDRVYALSTPSVVVVLRGSTRSLDALDVADLVARVPVGGLGIGRHQVAIALDPPEGLALVSVTPRAIVVRISAPVATSSPPPGGPASSSPPASPTQEP
jgi:YbbR domain-containing protein